MVNSVRLVKVVDEESALLRPRIQREKQQQLRVEQRLGDQSNVFSNVRRERGFSIRRSR